MSKDNVCEWRRKIIKDSSRRKTENSLHSWYKPKCNKTLELYLPTICPYCHKQIRVIEEEKDG